MKRILMALALLCGTLATAQNPYIALQGVSEGVNGIEVSQPRTVLAVDVTTERDMVLSGPYARYAQKYLGVRAALTDKTTWSLQQATIALIDGARALDAGAVPAPVSRAMSYTSSTDEFPRLQADKNDMIVLSSEDAARQAANAIFSLRKHRTELITGEAGENVFGEGLKAALDEIARQEQSYLELFLGKRVVSTQVKRYLVYPQSDKKQYILCRFSADAGLVSADDLSGELVIVQIKPALVPATGLEAGVKQTNVVACRVAAPSVCSVIFGTRELGSAELPIFEFGRTINVAIPRNK